MNLPFTADQFLDVFVRYNESVWPMQVVLNALAATCLVLVFRPSLAASRTVSLVLSLFWAWMAFAYHFTFFARINPVAWAFGTLFLAGSAAFAWFGFVESQLRFHWAHGAREAAGLSLIVFALLFYPLVGYLIGHRYPRAPTFGVPCPTTIFTLGLLLLAAPPVPRWVFIVPLLWVAIGSSAAFLLGVTEDLSLLVAGVLGIAGVLIRTTPSRG